MYLYKAGRQTVGRSVHLTLTLTLTLSRQIDGWRICAPHCFARGSTRCVKCRCEEHVIRVALTPTLAL